MRAVSAVFLVLLISIYVFPQTVIKEKVEITPKSNNSKKLSDQTFFNPDLCNWPVEYVTYDVQDKPACVYYGNAEFSSNPQHEEPDTWPVYIFEPGGNWVHCQVTQGEEYVTIKMDLGVDSSYFDPGYDFWIGGGDDMYLNFNKTRPENIARVTLLFTDGDNGRKREFNFDVYTPVFTIYPYAVQDSTLGYGENRQFSVKALNQCKSSWPWFPTYIDFTYKVEIIQGGEFGDLWQTYSNQYSKIFENVHEYGGQMDIVNFVADGKIPAQDEQIIIRVTPSLPDLNPVDITFTIRKPSIDVSFIPPKIAPGDTANVIFKLKNDDGTLSDISPWAMYDMKLLYGADYGTLYQPQWNYSAKEITDVTNGIQFIAAKEIPADSVSTTLLITPGLSFPGKITEDPKNKAAKSPPILSSIKTVKKVKNTLDDNEIPWGCGIITIAKTSTYMKAYFDRDILSPGDTANIMIKYVDAEGNALDYPDTTHFEIGIKDGCGLGQILDANGNKASFFSSIQQPIRFEVAAALEVDSAAIVLRVGGPKLDNESVLPSEKVKQNNNGSKNFKNITSISEKSPIKLKKITDDNYCANNSYVFDNKSLPEATILKPEINIIFTGPKEIWPYLPNQHKGGYSRGADKPGYNPYTSIKIQLQNNGKPLVDKEIKLQIKRTEGTGGHNHTNLLPNELCGEFFSNEIGKNPIVLSTDDNGEINIDKVLSSQIAGTYTIEASLVSNSQLKTDATFEVKVPNFIDFSTIDPHGIWRLTGRTQQHLDNHWCVSEMKNRLIIVLNKFYNWSKVHRKSQQGIVLGINDMSLVTGGVFDIYGDWNVGNQHSFHRIGYSVDIDNSGMTEKELSTLKILMTEQTGIRFPEDPLIHFSFLGGN
jgi:hypothetical protein